MTSKSAWRSLGSARLPLTPWPWRSVAYLLTGAVTGAAALIVFAALLLVGLAGSIVLVGIPLLVGVVLLGLPLGAVERRRLRLLDVPVLANPHRRPPRTGLPSWLRTRLTEEATWRELGHALLHATVLWPIDVLVLACGLVVPLSLLTAPAALHFADDGEVKLAKLWLVRSPGQAWVAVAVGALALLVACYAMVLYAAGRAALARSLVSPRGPAASIRALSRSRARLVDAFDAERRRIERDLHDGAQQRLVALSMTLGLARVASGEELPELLERAHRQSKDALADIRELIHGIHPRVLTERGLAAALAEVVDRMEIPVDMDVEISERPAPAVEAAGYFAVSEALANIAKHSGATRAEVTARAGMDALRLEVVDNGRGGADPELGTGLAGLADRIAVVDGDVILSSPPGGPTRVHVEIPWHHHRRDRSASSSPKTASSSAKGSSGS